MAGEPSVGDAFLRGLAARGVDFFFANPGTDFASIVEGLARAGRDGTPVPQPIVVPHENVAVGMAYGVAMVTGHPQAVMVHVNVGTANALCGLINASRENIPMLLCAGRTPILEAGALGARNLNIHWAQEMFDQGAIVREHVKWDYELRDPRSLDTVLDRALAIAKSEPRGPIYLSLPREVLAGAAVPSVATQVAPALLGAPDPLAIRELAALVAAARMPVIVTARAGGEPAAVAELAALAERYAIPVVEYRPRYNSLPIEHPMHGGAETGPWLDAADALVVLDSDVPWIPSQAVPRDGVKVAQIGADPLFARYPVRGFRSDLTITATPLAVIRSLAQALAANPPPADRVTTRRAEVATRVRTRRAALEEQIARGAQMRPMGMAYVSRVLAELLPADAIVINEYSLVPMAMRFDQPGTFFGSSPVGGLGWGVPAALGAKLAAPDRLVVAAVGDGSYEFANPLACHHTAALHGIAMLTVVMNNEAYGAVERATRSLYPEGSAAREGMELVSLAPTPAFETVISSCGGHGERVEDPAELRGAFEHALRVVCEERRQALVNVICR